MQKTVLMILVIAGLLCAGNVQLPSHIEVVSRTQAGEIAEPQQRSANASPMQRIVSISAGTVWRKSDRQDPETGFDVPPWTKVEVLGVAFKKRPVVGELVTVVRLGVNIEPIALKILKANRCEPVEEGLPPRCEVELPPVTQRASFDSEPSADRRGYYCPFDALILYPREDDACALVKAELRRDTLP